MTKLARVLLVFGGAAVGGAVGYLLTDLYVYKLIEAQFDDDELLDEWIPAKEIEEKSLKQSPLIPKDYTKFSKLTEKEPLEKIMKPYKSRDLRFITQEEILLAKNDFEKRTFTFYDLDKVWTDEDEVVQTNMPTLLDGSETPEELFGYAEKSDPDAVYLMDTDNKIYYELLCIHGSYDNLVLGYPIVAPKKPRKKKVVEEEDDGE